MTSLIKISEGASLALHTMALLDNEPGRRLTNQEIAETLHASGHHLAKVMQRLAKVGLVDSIRGRQGGFQLGKPAEQVTLLQVYEAIEGPLDDVGCLLGEPICSGKYCVLGEVLQSVHGQIRDYLKNTSLATLSQSLGLLQPIEKSDLNT